MYHWHLLFQFFSYGRFQWKWGLIGLVVLPISLFCAMILPWLIVEAVDSYIAVGDLDGLYRIVGFIFLAVVGGYLCDGAYTYSFQVIGRHAITEVREQLFQHVLRLPKSYYDYHPVGLLLSRLTSDTEAVEDAFSSGVMTTIPDALKALVLLATLLSLSWELTLACLLIVPPVAFILHLLRRRLRQVYDNAREALAKSMAFLQECLNGMQTIRIYSAEAKTVRQYAQKNQQFLHWQKQANIGEAILFSIVEGVTIIAVVIILWAGSYSIIQGSLSVGIIISFLNTLHRIFTPIREITQQLSTIQRAFSSLRQIDRLFQEPAEDRQSIIALTKKEIEPFQSLEFQNVSFRYSKSKPYVLKDVSFSLEQGQSIAIVGATGSGKSTIFRLIMQLYSNYEGSILLNDQELSTMPMNQIRSMMTLMQQDSYLFNETVGFNIGLDRVNQTEIERAAQQSLAYRFIKDLPNEYDFMIEEHGKNLSAGQVQLIAFAKAIAEETDLILLDEATSSIDSLTEHLIQDATTQLLEGKTVIAIAHRLSTIQHCDLILVMEDGQIIESGTHHDLMKQQGVYAQLAKDL